MAGLALALELLESVSSPKVLHSTSQASATVAAGFAAAAASFSYFPQHRFLDSLRSWGDIAACDGKATSDADDEWYGRWVPSPTYSQKTYVIELKPLFFAFKPKVLGAATVRSLLLNFLPMLQSFLEHDEEEEAAVPAEFEVNVALKRSGHQLLREVSVITARRVMERVVVYYCSARTAWKLLKDAPKSAARKAGRNLSSLELLCSVSKTAFRAHALGVGASWLVQEIIEIYRSGKIVYIHRKNSNAGVKTHQKELEVLKTFGRRSVGNTLKAVGALSGAAIMAGCGAVLINPSTGAWIGLAIGDLVGTYLVAILLDDWIYRTSS